MNRYFENPLELRLAFREFGTCVGIKCSLLLSHSEDDKILDGLASDILDEWEQTMVESTGDGTFGKAMQNQGLRPITKVMYTSALIPGGKFS